MKIACPLFAAAVALLLGWNASVPAAEDDVPKREPPNADAPAVRNENPAGPREGEEPRRPPRGEFGGDPNRPPEGAFRPDGSSRTEGGPRPEGGPRDDGGPRPQPGFRNEGGPPRGEFRGPGSTGPGVPMGHGGQAGPGMMHGGGPRGHGGPFGHDLQRMKDEDPEMHALLQGDQDLERETYDLSSRYRQTKKSEDREKLKTELQTAVEKHFQIRQQRRELELKRLEEQLQRMKDSVAKRLAEKGPIIELRVKELIGDNESGF